MSKQRVKDAIRLIEDVFYDTRVSKEQTLDWLEQIEDSLEPKIELLRSETEG